MNIPQICNEHIHKGDFIVNVGVHRCEEICPVLRNLNYEHGFFWGFEPNPDLAKQLEKNIKQGNIPNIEIIPKGVYDREDTLTFYNSPANDQASNTFESALVEDHNINHPYIFTDPGMTKIEIPVTSLDIFFPDQKIDFILSDAQGSDVKVIRGGQKLIATHFPSMIYEIYAISNEERQWAYEFLTGLGYSLYNIELGQKIETVDGIINPEWLNLFCIK